MKRNVTKAKRIIFIILIERRNMKYEIFAHQTIGDSYLCLFCFLFSKEFK